MPRRRIAFDEEAFALDHVSGRYTAEDLADKYALSHSLVKKIIAGKRRPEVRRKIDGAFSVARGRALRRLAGLQDIAIGTLANAMERGTPSAAVAAAREVLRSILGGEKARAAALAAEAQPLCPACQGLQRDLSQLSPETYDRVMEELLGPADPLPPWIVGSAPPPPPCLT